MSDRDGDGRLEAEADLKEARRTAGIAHAVVIRFKEMGLPAELDGDLAALCTDLGDIWSAERRLAEGIRELAGSGRDWESAADTLVDLKADLEHISWHLKSVRRPLNRIVNFAYREAMSKEQESELREPPSQSSPGSAGEEVRASSPSTRFTRTSH